MKTVPDSNAELRRQTAGSNDVRLTAEAHSTQQEFKAQYVRHHAGLALARSRFVLGFGQLRPGELGHSGVGGLKHVDGPGMPVWAYLHAGDELAGNRRALGQSHHWSDQLLQAVRRERCLVRRAQGFVIAAQQVPLFRGELLITPVERNGRATNSGIALHTLSDGSVFGVAESENVDRNGTLPSGALVPDEAASEGEAGMRTANEWIAALLAGQ